jgi:hypothetical protein
MGRPDSLTDLAAAVAELAGAAIPLSDADLGQPFRWGAHQEGARFALLGAMHELRALAVTLAGVRRRSGSPLTRAHHALGQYHAAYRDLEAALLGVSAEAYDAAPAPGEWPLRYVYAHQVATERHFFALVHYGLRRQREDGDLPAKLPEGEANRLHGPVEGLIEVMEKGSRDDMAAIHAGLHDRALAEFAGISDSEIDGPSIWWEGEPYTLEYRLHRCDAHLRQHTIQVDKTRDLLGHPISEARRLVRLLYAALAEAEAALVGAPGVGESEIAITTNSIRRLAEGLTIAAGRAREMLAAVTAGDRERVNTLLADDPQLANATSLDGVPVARLAVYYNQREIAEVLAASPACELEIWDAAALGRLARVEELHRDAGDTILNEFSRDGYTPLQLAAFFGHEDVARYLIAKGADVSAMAKNAMAIQPLHAAVAGNHQTIAALLLAAGVDPNAVQQDSFRPLHGAAQNGNADMVRLLLEHGADPALADGQGRAARALAEEGGYAEVAALL